jgi:hypothetical protein
VDSPPAHVGNGNRSNLRKGNGNNRFAGDSKRQALGAKEEGEQLRGHDPNHGIEEDGITHGVYEDGGDSTTGTSCVGIVGIAKMSTERHANGNHGAQHERTTPECARPRPAISHDEEVYDLAQDAHHAVRAADQERGPASEADGSVKDALEVLDDGRTAKLTHGDDEGGGEGAADILARKHLSQRVGPAQVTVSSLEGDLLPNLRQLLVEEVGVAVVGRAVQLGQDMPGVVVSVLQHQPARREWDEEDEHAEQSRYGKLHGQWDAPLAVALRKRTGIADPVGNTEADGDHHALEADEEAAAVGRRGFGKVDWHDGEDLTAADAGDEAAGDHHAHVGGGALEDGSHDGCRQVSTWERTQSMFLSERRTKEGGHEKSVLAADFVGKIAGRHAANGLASVVYGYNRSCLS